jgi:hypothetical protein
LARARIFFCWQIVSNPAPQTYRLGFKAPPFHWSVIFDLERIVGVLIRLMDSCT